MLEIILLSLLTIVASGVGTLTGFGTSTIMVPVLSLFMPLPQVLLLVGIIHWCGDVWKVILFREGVKWRLILAFGIPGIIASIIGASLTFNISKPILSKTLGVFLIAYVLFLLIKSNFKIPQKISAASIGGTLSGFFAGVFGVGGAVRGMFLTAFDLPKSVYIATAGVIAFAIDSARITTYLAGGSRLETQLALGLILFIPASFLGAKIAKKLIDRIPQEKFRIVVLVFLSLVGLKLLF